MAPLMGGLARHYVEVPAPDVARGGILAVARVVDSTDPHDLLGAEYLTDACSAVQLWDEYCTLTPASPKIFDDAPEVVVGDPFTLYAGVDCNLQRADEAMTRARRRFDYGERAGIDLAVKAWIDSLSPDDLSGPMPVDEAIGTAENHLAASYGGVPTILIPITVTACACRNGLVANGLDGSLMTCQGSRVGNYITTTVPVVLYATGQITLLRGPVETRSAPQQPHGDGTYDPPRAIAERTYVPLIECLAAKVEVTCS